MKGLLMSTEKKLTHGGKRAGAGRKPGHGGRKPSAFGEASKRFSLRIRPHEHENVQMFGDFHGIPVAEIYREGAKLYMAKFPKSPKKRSRST